MALFRRAALSRLAVLAALCSACRPPDCSFPLDDWGDRDDLEVWLPEDRAAWTSWGERYDNACFRVMECGRYVAVEGSSSMHGHRAYFDDGGSPVAKHAWSDLAVECPNRGYSAAWDVGPVPACEPTCLLEELAWGDACARLDPLSPCPGLSR